MTEDIREEEKTGRNANIQDLFLNNARKNGLSRCKYHVG